VNLEPATLGRLAKIPNIIAVKEASGNISQIAEVFNHVPDNFLVFSGDDAITLPVISLGGVGIVSVVSNEIPKEMSDLTAAALRGDWQKARALQRRFLPLMQANFIEANPMPVKAVLAMMGRIEEVYRLPMVLMKPDTRAKLQQIATEVGVVKRSAAAD
jgi:4-hydroxy-tetrahydrodipicolinate synthase